MDPEVTPEVPNAQPETPPDAPKPPTENMVPQSKVDEIVAKEKAKTERRVRKELEAELKAPEKKPEPKSDSDVLSRLAKMESDLSFERALNKIGFVPDDEQSDLLRSVYDSGGVEKMMVLAGKFKPAAAPSPKAEEKSAPTPTANPSPIKTPGAAVGVPVNSMDIPPSQMTKADVERMQEAGTFFDWMEKNGRGSARHLFGGKRARIMRGMPK